MDKQTSDERKIAGASQMARGLSLQAHPLLPSLRAEAPAI
jgi:hypothetical protein